MAELTPEVLSRHLASLGGVEEINAYLRKARALTAANADEAIFEPEVESLRDYLARDIPIPPSLVWPTIVVRGEITTTLGRAGKGKTTLNLNRIMSWAAGRALFPGWCDREGNEYLSPEKPLRTLIAENEGNAAMFHQKMGLMVSNGPLSKEEQEMALDNLWIHGDGGYSGMKLDNDEGVEKLRRAIDKCKPDIVFIEPFRSLWRGEENSATDMAVVVDNIVGLATEFQCGIILSHHEKKGDGGESEDKMSKARGSTVLEGIVAVMENFESVKDGEYREMTWSKARYLEAPAPTRMEWSRETGWYEWIPQEAIEDSIVLALRESPEPMSITDLHEALSEPKQKLRNFTKTLVKDGRIKTVASVATQHGSTGPRFRLPSDDGDNGGLPV